LESFAINHFQFGHFHQTSTNFNENMQCILHMQLAGFFNPAVAHMHAQLIGVVLRVLQLSCMLLNQVNLLLN